MTASTPDELIAGFPHSSLLKVTGEPTFEDLKVIWRLLNTNAMSVASYKVGGRHGHLGIMRITLLLRWMSSPYLTILDHQPQLWQA
jgi:hypothetical protein